MFRKIKKPAGIVSKIIDREAVIILPAQGQVKVLNEVGARIWELVDGNRSLADIVDLIFEEYAVAREEAERDVLEFIQHMVDANLVITE